MLFVPLLNEKLNSWKFPHLCMVWDGTLMILGPMGLSRSLNFNLTINYKLKVMFYFMNIVVYQTLSQSQTHQTCFQGSDNMLQKVRNSTSVYSLDWWPVFIWRCPWQGGKFFLRGRNTYMASSRLQIPGISCGNLCVGQSFISQDGVFWRRREFCSGTMRQR